jgi:hypothetical protein
MSTSPGKLNLTFSQGATWVLDMTWTNDTGNPISLVNYSARMQARVSYESPDPVLTLTNGSGITLGGTAGSIDLLVNANVTSAIDADQYVYDLELESNSGQVTRLVEGTLTVTPEVTR